MSWTDSGAKALIYGPNGTGSDIVQLSDDSKDGKRYFIVGCFVNGAFQKVAQSTTSVSIDMCP